MYLSKAFVPVTISNLSNKKSASLYAVITGVAILSLLAQFKINLPWTPVPITGQTFGVSLLAMLWGSRLSFSIFLSYLALGFIGAPVFAGGVSGFSFGPTFGYLIGMLVASWAVGKFADRGWGRKFGTALLGCYLGSLIIFTFGCAGLAFILPVDKLLIAGVLPFLPGDLIKNLLAAFLVSNANRKINKE